MVNSRKHDLEDLRRDWKTADPYQRKQIERAADAIKKESGKVRSMRERLVKEHRQANKENIKDIYDYIEGKERYRNEMNE